MDEFVSGGRLDLQAIVNADDGTLAQALRTISVADAVEWHEALAAWRPSAVEAVQACLAGVSVEGQRARLLALLRARASQG